MHGLTEDDVPFDADTQVEDDDCAEFQQQF